ncbi:hypothetical protein LIER_02441 [Lithospermum erythrorhizon]|uniref:Bifunctional inhibitor/plant lipid transfer protein/seed storage helical domain-containing protein n=1 Tax=Lithospermum erythrorhizon TaxID=34254 RepID=A0AAV3NPI0_LITER
MASMKSIFSSFPSTLVVVLLLVVLVQSQVLFLAEAQPTCSASLGNLNVCTPFLVPGSSASNYNPSPECCNAIQAVGQDCLCNTLRMVSHLPAQCNLSPQNEVMYARAILEMVMDG